MNTLLRRVLLVLLQLLLVAVGAVFALAVICGVVALFCVWAVRRGWARLTGRPVTPWVLRTDPMAVWRQAGRFRAGGVVPAETGAKLRTPIGDVTDVTPK